MVRALDAVALSFSLLAPLALAQAPREPFATKHAQYVPVSWGDLPGWPGGATMSAWSAFLQGCRVLVRRPAWEATCQRASFERPANPAAVRQFFEREFEAFQVRTSDLVDTGVLTGYFEPLLDGSRVRTAALSAPCLRRPRGSSLPRRALFWARAAPRSTLESTAAMSCPCPGKRRRANAIRTELYRLEVSQAPAGLRDRKIRVRRSGDRIVPYFTRQEIEQHGLASAEPIAWVDDPDLLYILHIQGSGRIRLTSGETLRVAFGEQNGHPFLPKVSTAPSHPCELVA